MSKETLKFGTPHSTSIEKFRASRRERRDAIEIPAEIKKNDIGWKESLYYIAGFSIIGIFVLLTCAAIVLVG